MLDELRPLLDEVADAGHALAGERKVPAEVRAVVQRVAAAREQLASDDIRACDPYLLLALDEGLLAAWRGFERATSEDERAVVRVALEQVRQALRDLIDDEPASDTRPAGEVARWLHEVLDAPQPDVARVLGVSPRQYQRWLSSTDPAEPRGDDARRLRTLARLVAHLRHVFTGAGVLAWLTEPHPALAGAAPAELLDHPDETPRLRRLASSARSSAAA